MEGGVVTSGERNFTEGVKASILKVKDNSTILHNIDNNDYAKKFLKCFYIHWVNEIGTKISKKSITISIMASHLKKKNQLSEHRTQLYCYQNNRSIVL